MTADSSTAKRALVVGVAAGTLSPRAVVRASDVAGPQHDVSAASAVIGRVERAAYVPDPARADVYDEHLAEYRTVRDYFSGRRERAGNDVPHRLRSRRNGANPE